MKTGLTTFKICLIHIDVSCQVTDLADLKFGSRENFFFSQALTLNKLVICSSNFITMFEYVCVGGVISECVSVKHSSTIFKIFLENSYNKKCYSSIDLNQNLVTD